MIQGSSLKAKIWMAMLAIYLVWGSTYLAIRFAVETIPPFIMVGTRFAIAGAILYVWTRRSGAPAPKKLEWRSAVIIAAFLLLGGNGGVTWAEQYVPSGIAALIVASEPLMIVLIDALHPGGRRPNRMTMIGVLLGFAGIVLLIGPQQLQGGEQSFHPVGLSVLFLAALLWAIGSLYNRQAHLPRSALLGTGMEMLAGSAGFFLLATLTGEWSRLDIASITPRSLWGLFYLITGGALVGFSAYTWLLRVAPTPLVSTYAYVNPLIAVILGSLLVQEPFTARIALASGIILSSVALINTARSRSATAEDVILSRN